MHRKWTTRLAAAGTVLGVCVTFAASPAGAGGGNTDGTLVLGHLGPETGDLAPVIESIRTSVQLAVAEVNAAGGIDGNQVALLTGDEGSDPDAARATVGTMLDGGADAIIGPASSSTALEILESTKGSALICSGSTSSDALTKEGPRRSGGLFFRTAPPDRFQGPALAEEILADGHSKVAVIARDDSYGDPLADALATSLREGGAKVPVVARYDPDSDDVSSQVQEALDSKPQAIAVIGLLEDGAKVVRALIDADAGPATLPTYGTDGIYSSQLAALVDPLNPGIVAGLSGTAPASAPSGVSSPFHDAFAATGLDAVFSAHYYDCAILTALAAVKAKSDDPKRMAKVFASNLKGANDCNTFAACRDLLVAGKTIHWRGASSSFDRFGKFEPTEGVYQPWSYDAGGTPVDGDPSTQIKIF
jgi:branched-chain amino acid transport system substrate-binding protein